MGPYVCITGASSGIGKAYAYAFAQRGYNLILIARREERLKAVQKDIENLYSITVLFYTADITQKEVRSNIIQKISSLPIAILVNNAGIGDCSVFETSSLDKQLGMIELNITALVHFTHALLPQIRTSVTNGLTNKGYIVNIGSVAGFQPGPYMATYYATKSYVLSFSEALAEESRKTSKAIHVCVVCPGPTQSEFGEFAGFEKTQGIMGKIFTKYVNVIPTAEKLVEYSIKRMFRGKRIIVHGNGFKMLHFISRFLPRIIVTKIVGRLQTTRIKK